MTRNPRWIIVALERIRVWAFSQPGSVFTGTVVGMTLVVFAVAVGALLFGTYGYGMFVVSPFTVGLTTGYLVNRRRDIGLGHTVKNIFLATVLGSLALLALGLEGLICIVLVVPIAFPLAVLGGIGGRAWALRQRHRVLNSFAGFAVLPLVFGIEQLTIGLGSFEVTSSIDIDAPPTAVWAAITKMPDIKESPALPFRLGVAYPIGASIAGEGVGALRYGFFSTGTAVERVATWEFPRVVTFDILAEPPSMRELSPYQHVHAPHVHGYLTTRSMSFVLESLPGARTRLLLDTTHELKLEPIDYWCPIARQVIKANDSRVLTHLKRVAESSSARAVFVQ